MQSSTRCPYCTRRYKSYQPLINHLNSWHSELPPIVSRAQTENFTFLSQDVDGEEDNLDTEGFILTASTKLPKIDLALTTLSPGQEHNCIRDAGGLQAVGDLSDGQANCALWTYDTQTFSSAGKTLEDSGQPKPVPPVASQMWAPFSSAYDFKLASWFIRSHTPSSYINEFFNSELAGEGRSSFTSTYTLHKTLKRMDSDMGQTSWLQEEAIF